LKKILLILLLLIPSCVNAFSTNAKSAILMDMDSKRILYAKDVNYTQSVASISKIMTAILSIEKKDVNDVVTIGDEILKAYGSGIYVKQGEKIKLEDLLYGLMLRSGNDAAVAIANYAGGSVDNFVKEMNKKAKEIGMKNTTFNNPSGLDEKEQKGNFSSAYDMAILMSYAMKNKEFKKIVGTKSHNVKTNMNYYKWTNKNKLLFSYKYTTGGKTGFTKKAKRTLVTTASKNNLNLAVVTINDGSDFADHQKLFEEAFDNYTNYRILKKGTISILGEDYYKENKLYIKEDFTYPLLDSEKDSLNLKFELEKNKNYKTNDKVGIVKVFLGDKKITEKNIYVEKKEKPSFFDKLKNLFGKNNDK